MDDMNGTRICENCKGEGTVDPVNPADAYDMCPVCGGYGEIYGETTNDCPNCGSIELCNCSLEDKRNAVTYGKLVQGDMVREIYKRFDAEDAQQLPADQQRQPADLTPDEVGAPVKLEPHEVNALRCFAEGAMFESRYGGLDNAGFKLLEMGFIRQDYSMECYHITDAGRAHLAALTSAPADTITVSLSDAYEIHTALVAQVIRLTEHIDDPDYEGDTDNLVRIIRETEAVLDRLTKQLQ